MNEQWLANTINELRRIGNDSQRFEVKEAKQSLPKSLVETMSAFSNSSGGFIILGISEKNGFAPVEGFEARRIQDALANECDKLTPPVRPQIEVIPFEESLVVCARVKEMHPRDKPCYITARGMYDSSYVRTGDGDRRMTSYEVDRYMEEHLQPTYDDDAVEGAELADLDAELLAGFVRRQKELHPGTSRTERVNDSRRFLDNQSIVGSIPVMIEDAIAAVVRNTRTGAVIEGAFRRDVPDYPATAVREAIANALMHRDYSPESRGSQVQVNLYVDRLEIINPGGLYGDVTIESLGTSGVSSARNQFLSNILETTPYPAGGYVVENRGTGYQEIGEQLRRALMPPARPHSSTVAFSLTLDRRRVAPSERKNGAAGGVDDAILDYLAKHSSASMAELVSESGLSRSSITSHVRSLIESGSVEPMEPPRSPKQRYRLVR